jgi:hypothetical protein
VIVRPDPSQAQRSQLVAVQCRSLSLSNMRSTRLCCL